MFQERNVYLPLANHASKLYFVITDLAKVNNMYQFSLSAFLRLFHRNLERTEVRWSFFVLHKQLKTFYSPILWIIYLFHFIMQKGSSQERVLSLGKNQLRMAYSYISRSLFKVDRLMFAMHLAHGMFSKKIPEQVQPFIWLTHRFELIELMFTFQEWNHFVGLSVADVKDTRSLPTWISEERAFDVASFKVENRWVSVRHF